MTTASWTVSSSSTPIDEEGSGHYLYVEYLVFGIIWAMEDMVYWFLIWITIINL